jgi:predicted alpha/beta-fold hydrolase
MICRVKTWRVYFLRIDILTSGLLFCLLEQKPKVYASNVKIRSFLSEHLPILNEKYWPTWWIWEGRLQSIMGLFQRISESEKIPYKRDIVTLNDGGELALDCLEPAQPPEGYTSNLKDQFQIGLHGS